MLLKSIASKSSWDDFGSQFTNIIECMRNNRKQNNCKNDQNIRWPTKSKCKNDIKKLATPTLNLIVYYHVHRYIMLISFMDN